MTFMLYKVVEERHQTSLTPSDETYSLPSLLQKAWQRRQKPASLGWDISADELIRIHSDDHESYKTRRLLSDFHPSATWRIGIVEIQHIYAYTWGDDAGKPTWTPFMLKGRDVFYKDNYENLNEKQKKQTLAKLREFDPAGTEFVEFLYTNVNKNGTWVWGRSGMTNAAFLQGEARTYFKLYF